MTSQDPQVPGRRFNEIDAYKNSPYWTYFKKVWGNAPMIDTNFRLWLGGFFKSYAQPKAAAKYQETQSLPSYFNYFGKTYDPLKDPPYPSEFQLFENGKPVPVPDEARAEDGTYTGDIRSDCTNANKFANAEGYKRPCGVNEIAARSQTKEKDQDGLKKILGRTAHSEGAKMPAGSPRGSIYFTYDKPPEDLGGEGKNPWIGLDQTWGRNKISSETDRPKNLPKPPKDIPRGPEKITYGFAPAETKGGEKISADNPKE
jgi:hypothetical protein